MYAFMESWNNELIETGELVDAQSLAAPVHARRIQLQGGVPVVTDGPYVELGVSATTANKLVELAPSVLRELEEVDVPDRVELQINLGTPTNEDLQAIERLSPGQRATALLALALAAGDEPLVIDQPEDDLDNRYIFAEVVQVLARVCERRQVMAATHNANIPILGDAEMLVALDAVADRSNVLVVGGLEDPEVAGCARQIL